MKILQERVAVTSTIPMIKILMIITSSSQSPAKVDNIAIPKASPPADNVPNPRLNPLLRVAPRNASDRQEKKICKHDKINKKKTTVKSIDSAEHQELQIQTV